MSNAACCSGLIASRIPSAFNKMHSDFAYIMHLLSSGIAAEGHKAGDICVGSGPTALLQYVRRTARSGGVYDTAFMESCLKDIMHGASALSSTVSGLNLKLCDVNDMCIELGWAYQIQSMILVVRGAANDISDMISRMIRVEDGYVDPPFEAKRAKVVHLQLLRQKDVAFTARWNSKLEKLNVPTEVQDHLLDMADKANVFAHPHLLKQDTLQLLRVCFQETSPVKPWLQKRFPTLFADAELVYGRSGPLPDPTKV